MVKVEFWGVVEKHESVVELTSLRQNSSKKEVGFRSAFSLLVRSALLQLGGEHACVPSLWEACMYCRRLKTSAYFLGEKLCHKFFFMTVRAIRAINTAQS